MMPFETWATEEVVTDTNFNNMIDHARSTQLIYALPDQPTITGSAGLDIIIKAAPFVGQYLHVRALAYNDGTNGDLQALVTGPAGQESAGTVTVTSSTEALYSITVDCSTLTLNGDIRGKDVQIHIYASEHLAFRGLQAWTGESSTAADYGG